jgi:hypothetical protein
MPPKRASPAALREPYVIEIPGAGGGNRTRDIQLGKLTFYL